MKNPKSRALFDYWNTLRAGRAAPFRSEINPRDISRLLESTFILEHVGKGKARYRLAGTKLCASFGMELRGMDALSLWHGDCRAKVRDTINRVIEEPVVGQLACTVETRSGYLFDAEFLYLPLRADSGEMTRVLGCGHYMGSYGRHPETFEPLLHWVDDVTFTQIDISNTDIGNGPGPYSQPQSPLMREAMDILHGGTARDHAPSGAQRRLSAMTRARTLSEHLLDKPAQQSLRMIEGGIKASAPLSVSARKESPMRSILRVVK
ncbi:MAG: PAS domain-containing protein [Neomegalonema sp.]|nr:PAS domain-containing protein [Neomegalonema sp.]